MDYENKHVLAPMVRVGTLPFRLLSAEYGADITYGEEIIDHKFLKCERRVNDFLGTTDFVEKGTGDVVFRTCAEERNRVVFQMGTSDSARALAVAELVSRKKRRAFHVHLESLLVWKKDEEEEACASHWRIFKALNCDPSPDSWRSPLRSKDVAAIDINMGCPKSFSISGGMGAALLSKPELVHDILTTLRRNLDSTLTCKIRLLNSSQNTVEFARRIEMSGVSALAVHGRRIKDRPRDPAMWNEIADVVSALSIPVIANGDVFEYGHFERIKSVTGATSVMVARGALWNASIFRAEGKSSWEDIKREYMRKCILWDNDVKSTKHTLKEMIMHYSCLEFDEGKAVTKSKTIADLANFYGEDEYYQLVTKSRRR